MKKLKILFYFGIAFSLISCASNNVSKVKGMIYSDEKEVIQANAVQTISTSKTVKDEFTAKSVHVKNSANNGSVPVSVYKLSLEENTVYSFTLKSIPTGLMSLSEEKKSVMIPEVFLYDENFNLVENLNLRGETIAPTTTESLLFRVTTKWEITESGNYYLVVKSDMSSSQGITLTVYNYNTSTDVYFKRLPYGKFSFIVE